MRCGKRLAKGGRPGPEVNPLTEFGSGVAWELALSSVSSLTLHQCTLQMY